MNEQEKVNQDADVLLANIASEIADAVELPKNISAYHKAGIRAAFQQFYSKVLPFVTVAVEAKKFVHEPENWESWQELQTSNSASIPVEYMNLCEAVEEVFGEPIFEEENGESIGAVTTPVGNYLPDDEPSDE
jgi:hypothetical protein